MTRATATKVQAGNKIAGRLGAMKDIGVRKVTEVFSSAKTVGQQWRMWDRVEAIPSGKLSGLSSEGRERLGSLVSRFDTDGAAAFGSLDSRTFRSVLGDCPGQNQRRYYSGVSGSVVPTDVSGPPCDYPEDVLDAFEETVQATDSVDERAWEGLAAVSKQVDSQTEGKIVAALLEDGSTGLQFFQRVKQNGISSSVASRPSMLRDAIRFDMPADELSGSALAMRKVEVFRYASGKTVSPRVQNYFRNLRDIQSSDTDIVGLKDLVPDDAGKVTDFAYETRRVLRHSKDGDVERIKTEVQMDSATSDIDYAVTYQNGATRYIEAKNRDPDKVPNKKWVTRRLQSSREKWIDNSDLVGESGQNKFVLELGTEFNDKFDKKSVKTAIETYIQDSVGNPNNVLVDEVVVTNRNGNSVVFKIQNGEVTIAGDVTARKQSQYSKTNTSIGRVVN